MVWYSGIGRSSRKTRRLRPLPSRQTRTRILDYRTPRLIAGYRIPIKRFSHAILVISLWHCSPLHTISAYLSDMGMNLLLWQHEYNLLHSPSLQFLPFCPMHFLSRLLISSRPSFLQLKPPSSTHSSTIASLIKLSTVSICSVRLLYLSICLDIDCSVDGWRCGREIDGWLPRECRIIHSRRWRRLISFTISLFLCV